MAEAGQAPECPTWGNSVEKHEERWGMTPKMTGLQTGMLIRPDISGGPVEAGPCVTELSHGTISRQNAHGTGEMSNRVSVNVVDFQANRQDRYVCLTRARRGRLREAI